MLCPCCGERSWIFEAPLLWPELSMISATPRLLPHEVNSDTHSLDQLFKRVTPCLLFQSFISIAARIPSETQIHELFASFDAGDAPCASFLNSKLLQRPEPHAITGLDTNAVCHGDTGMIPHNLGYHGCFMNGG